MAEFQKETQTRALADIAEAIRRLSLSEMRDIGLDAGAMVGQEGALVMLSYTSEGDCRVLVSFDMAADTETYELQKERSDIMDELSRVAEHILNSRWSHVGGVLV